MNKKDKHLTFIPFFSALVELNRIVPLLFLILLIACLKKINFFGLLCFLVVVYSIKQFERVMAV